MENGKKLIALLLCVCMMLSLFGCGNGEETVKGQKPTQETGEQTPGSPEKSTVTVLSEETWRYSMMQDETPDWRYIYEYDEYGRMVSVTEYYTLTQYDYTISDFIINEPHSLKTEYSYDAEGKINDITVYLDETTVVGEASFLNDGQIEVHCKIHYEHADNLDEEYIIIYDQNGRVLQESRDGIVTYFNDNGEAIKEEWEEISHLIEFEYEYDSNGNPVQKKYYDFNGNEICETIINEYDRAGNLIRKKIVKAEEDYHILTYKYKEIEIRADNKSGQNNNDNEESAVEISDNQVTDESNFTEVLQNLMESIGYNTFSETQKSYCRGDFFDLEGKTALVLMYYATNSTELEQGYYVGLWVMNDKNTVSCMTNQLLCGADNADDVYFGAGIKTIENKNYLNTYVGTYSAKENTEKNQYYLIGDQLSLAYDLYAVCPIASDTDGIIVYDERNCIYSINQKQVDSDTFYSTQNTLNKKTTVSIEPEGFPPTGRTFAELLEYLKSIKGTGDATKDTSSQANQSENEESNTYSVTGPLSYPISEEDCYIIYKNYFGCEMKADKTMKVVVERWGKGDQETICFSIYRQNENAGGYTLANAFYVKVNTGECSSEFSDEVFQAEDYYYGGNS